MLGYTKEDLDDMVYGIDCALLMINNDENPATTRSLTTALEFLQGLWAEGYFD